MENRVCAMQFRFDDEANALYIALHPGKVVRTIALTDTISVDIDAEGDALGIEFVSADELVPFLRWVQAHEAGDAWAAEMLAVVRELFAARAA